MFKKLMVSLLLGISMQAVSSAQTVPLDSFVRSDQFSHPRLSPDGSYLAITQRHLIGGREVPVIQVYSLANMKQVAGVRMPSFQMPLSYLWVNKTRMLITVGKEVGSREAPISTGEILAMDFDGENQEYLFGYDMEKRSRHGEKYGDNLGHGSIDSIPKERDGSFAMSVNLWESEGTMLYRVDAKNGRRKLLASVNQPNVDFLLQHSGTVRFAHGTDKVGYSVLQKYDNKNNTWSVLPHDYTGNLFSPIMFSLDDKEVYALHSKKGEPIFLIKEEIESGKRTTLLEDPDGTISRLQWGMDHYPPFAASSSIGIPKLHYLDSDRKDSQLHRVLSESFPGQAVQFINYTEDGSKLLFKVASDRDPGAYYLYHENSKKADFLFASREQIDPDQMAKKTPIEFIARDGLKIFGYVTLPNKANPNGKHPLVILPHGGPHGISDEWFFDNDVQFLASRGYAVLQVNFRGSGGRGQNFIEKGYKKWASEIQYDIIDGVNWVLKNMPVDENRMCTYGVSFGGYSALMLASLDHQRIKCAVGYAGVYDLNLIYSDEVKGDSRFTAAVERFVGKDKEELRKNSPSTYVDKLTMPIFLVHGKEDKRATFSHALAMRDALMKVNRAPEWMALDNEGHGFYKTENVKEFYRRLETFLDKHIGAK
ncbi:alpha/beta hydrolase family protein [Undibacterium sp.]|uniref:alpha/beta hydrolase family protein n=1 Tax=Undibacterium sp. TaxID=1914977 RepID=UPI003751DEDC